MEAVALMGAGGLVLVCLGLAASYRAWTALQPAVHILRSDPLPVQELVYHEGPAEVEGTARGDEKGVKAPFTGTVCLAYEYEVEELRNSGKSSSWQTLDEGSAAAPFLLEDDTGSVRVDGQRAELHLEDHTLVLKPGEQPPARIAEYIDENEAVDQQDGTVDLVVTELNYGNEQRFTERRLDIDESVHVYGHVGSAPAGEWGSGIVDARLTESDRTPLLVSDTTERTAAWRIIKRRLFWPIAGGVLLVGGLYVLSMAVVPGLL